MTVPEIFECPLQMPHFAILILGYFISFGIIYAFRSLLELSYPKEEPLKINIRFETPAEPFGGALVKPTEQPKHKQIFHLIKDVAITFNPYRLMPNPDMLSSTPDDLQNKILEYLPPRDLAHAECINTEMYSAASSRKLWNALGDPRQWVTIEDTNYKTTRYRCALFVLSFVHVSLFLVQWGIDIWRMNDMRMSGSFDYFCFGQIIWFSPNSKSIWTGVIAFFEIDRSNAWRRMNKTTRKCAKVFVHFSALFYVLLGLPYAIWPSLGVYILYFFLTIGTLLLCCGLGCLWRRKLLASSWRKVEPPSVLYLLHFVCLFFVALGIVAYRDLTVDPGYFATLENVVVDFFGAAYFENVPASWVNVIVLVNALL